MVALKNPVIALVAVIAVSLSPTVVAEKVKLKPLPDKLGNDGLVIMQIAPYAKWRDAEVRFSDGSKGRAYDGFFVRKLRPGKYTIESVKRASGYSSDVVSQTTYYSILRVDREFEVQAGKVTHLGLQYLLENPENDGRTEGGEFFALAFDNKGSEHAFLSEYYPRLADNLSPNDVIADPHDYDNDKLPMIREVVVQLALADAVKARKNGSAIEGLRGSNAIEITESTYIVGDLGLIARAGTDGKPQYFALDSVDRVAQVQGSRDNPWFYTRAGDLYRLAGDDIEKVTTKPRSFLPSNGVMLSDNAIALSDRQFSFLISIDNGQSWKQSDVMAMKARQSVDTRFNVGIDNVFAIVDDRAVILGSSGVAAIDKATGVVSEFELPKSIAKNVHTLLETRAGMFAATLNPNWSARLYHRPVGSDEWEKNRIAKTWYCKVGTADASGEELTAECHGTKMISRDYGKTWQLAQTASLSSQ